MTVQDLILFYLFIASVVVVLFAAVVRIAPGVAGWVAGPELPGDDDRGHHNR